MVLGIQKAQLCSPRMECVDLCVLTNAVMQKLYDFDKMTKCWMMSCSATTTHLRSNSCCVSETFSELLLFDFTYLEMCWHVQWWKVTVHSFMICT